MIGGQYEKKTVAFFFAVFENLTAMFFSWKNQVDSQSFSLTPSYYRSISLASCDIEQKGDSRLGMVHVALLCFNRARKNWQNILHFNPFKSQGGQFTTPNSTNTYFVNRLGYEN